MAEFHLPTANLGTAHVARTPRMVEIARRTSQYTYATTEEARKRIADEFRRNALPDLIYLLGKLGYDVEEFRE